MRNESAARPAEWLVGGGDMGDAIRAFDWSATPLGPRDRWPQSLRTAVSICLGSRFPMMLWWGPSLINLYNDAFVPVLGGWHPRALGMSGRDVWTDTWPVIGPQVARVMEEGDSTLNERVRLVYTRHGFPEETWFTWSFGPIRDESGRVGGLFNTCHEDTLQVLAERDRNRLAAEQERLLSELRNERSRLAEVIERAPAFICALRGPDHVFEFANERYYQIAGRRDIVGKAVRDVQPEVEAQGYLDILDRVYRTGEPFAATEMPLVLRRGDGEPAEPRFINVAWQALREADGSVSGVFVHGVDVTDLVRSREALRASEERHRRLVETAHEGVWIIDGAGRTTYVNRRMADLLGYAPQEMIGRVHTDFMWEQDRPKGDVDMELRRQGAAQVWDQRYRRKGGDELWTVASCSALHDADGTFVGALGMFTDITDRKRAEAALRGREERLRRMVNIEGVGVLTFDAATGTLVDANDWFLATSGFTREEVAARALSWRTLTPPEHVAESLRQMALLPATGRVGPYEKEYFRKDGSKSWMLFAGAGVGDGSVVEYCIDISDRRRAEAALRESEERFRQLADAMPQMVWVTRPDGFHEYYNRRWYEFTGVPAGSTDGEGWSGMFHPDDQDRAWAAWRHSLETGEPYEVEYRLRHHSGEYRWTLGRALPVRDAAGAVTKWFGTCTEIDALKRLQQERESLLAGERAARAEAERAGRVKDEFLATLSHELRTPLNAILGWSQIIGRSPGDAREVADGLAVIERNARTQAQIIEDLLDMSRIISGKVRLDVQRLDLAAAVRAAADTARPAADAKGVRLQIVLDPHAGPVSGDPNRLQQVFWNLVSNAVKFTPRGGRVQVRLERVNSHLEVSVVDSGEGISPEFLPHVFDRFRQADGSTTRRHGGLGLGLAIVKQLVELHGGGVRAESAGAGHGSTFTVVLPLTAVLREEPPAAGERHPAQGGGGCPDVPDTAHLLAGVRVLVVDDEPDARGLVRRVLEDCGAEVATAGSAAEAFERVLASRPDVLVSDVGMPGEDGYSFIARVRALGRERGGRVPALALTAYARAEDRVRAVYAGFQAHVPKPVEPAELVAVVAGLAGRTGAASG